MELSAVLKVGAAGPGDGRAGALSVVLKMPLVRAAQDADPRVPRAVEIWGHQQPVFPLFSAVLSVGPRFSGSQETPGKIYLREGE